MPVSITVSYPPWKTIVNHKRYQEFARSLLFECEKGDFHFSILFTDDTTMRELNNRYRNKDTTTNVLSFPFSAEDETDLTGFGYAELGDIAISVDTATREARELRHTTEHRICWLIVHGFLHLLGHDHERSEKDAEEMFQLEQLLLKKLRTKRSSTMPKLAINVDHVATVRQARGGLGPDPVTAASICEMAGASGIVVHLREDRRHIQDKDVYLLRKSVKTKLNLEMGANKEIVNIALDVGPDMVTLVPEKREELTTEGGLDVISQKKKIAKTIARFQKAGIPVSIFVDPDIQQIKSSHDIGAHFVEIHTGRYCDAQNDDVVEQEFQLIADAAEEAYQLGLVVNGGHGLDYHNTSRIAALETIDELSIGHAIVSRSIFSGLDCAVRDMLSIIQNAQLQLY